MQELPPRQAAGLAAIERLTRERGFAPTLRELAEDMKVSRSAIAQMLNALARKGFVHWEAGDSRTLRVVAQPPQAPPDDIVAAPVQGPEPPAAGSGS